MLASEKGKQLLEFFFYVYFKALTQGRMNGKEAFFNMTYCFCNHSFKLTQVPLSTFVETTKWQALSSNCIKELFYHPTKDVSHFLCYLMYILKGKCFLTVFPKHYFIFRNCNWFYELLMSNQQNYGIYILLLYEHISQLMCIISLFSTILNLLFTFCSIDLVTKRLYWSIWGSSLFHLILSSPIIMTLLTSAMYHNNSDLASVEAVSLA